MDTLKVTLHSIDDKAMFNATARDNPQIVVDYFPPVGTGQGYTSLELLMASFGSCISTTLLTLLRHKMNKVIEGIKVAIVGEVREEHPKALNKMNVTLDINAKDLTNQEVEQALKVAEDKFCPVWSMIKGNVDITFETTISN